MGEPGAGPERAGEVRVLEGREVLLSSLDKVLWPRTGFTKRALIDYYERTAPVLLPHLARRPVTLGRFPDGVERPGFAQTECRGRPAWLAVAPIRLRSGVVRNYCLINDLPSLLWVANLGTIELHPFLARNPRLDQPPVIVFDLDPTEPAGMTECAGVALLVRDLLAGRGLSAVAKTSGSAGMHLFVPLNTPHSYSGTRAFARSLAETLATRHAGVVARAAGRAQRAGTILVDWAQNSERRSIIAPYSLRAGDRPAVSCPVSWREIESAAAGADGGGDGASDVLDFDPATALERIARYGDLFEGALTITQGVAGSGP